MHRMDKFKFTVKTVLEGKLRGDRAREKKT
jgi:hypothetical protein